jgi:hypothetical protein
MYCRAWIDINQADRDRTRRVMDLFGQKDMGRASGQKPVGRDGRLHPAVRREADRIFHLSSADVLRGIHRRSATDDRGA